MPRPILAAARRAGALLLLLLLVAPAAHARVLPRFGPLHVGPPAGPGATAQILDASGRSVLLRGVNVNGLEDYFSDSPTPTRVAYPVDPAAYEHGRCPARDPTVESVPVCRHDARQIAAFGYDVVRLAVSWSLLEPTPGHIDARYVARIAQVVGWLREEGVATVLDMHQDAWSKFLYTHPGQSCPPPLKPVTGPHESDGAPAWASMPVTPVCQLAAREVDPAVQEAFQRLWSDAAGPDGVGLQEHVAGAVLALARRFHREPAVVGYDILNEPSPGFAAPDVALATEILPFYAKVIRTVRAGVPGFRGLFFVEPDVTRDVTDGRTAFTPWSGYSPYRDVVFAPHVYTHVFTPDAEAGAPGLAPLFPVAAGYDRAAEDARALGLALWDGEFGTRVADDATTLREHYESMDRLAVGGVLWVWKADGTVEHGAFSAMQGPFGKGSPFPSRVTFTDRAYPLATAGTLRALRYTPQDGTLDLAATSPPVRRGDATHATVVYVPASATGRVRVANARLRVRAVGRGARELDVYPRGGDYRVRVGPRLPAG